MKIDAPSKSQCDQCGRHSDSTRRVHVDFMVTCVDLCDSCAAELAKQLEEKPVEATKSVKLLQLADGKRAIAIKLDSGSWTASAGVDGYWHGRTEDQVAALPGEYIDPFALTAQLATLQRLNDEQAARLAEQRRELDRLERENARMAANKLEIR